MIEKEKLARLNSMVKQYRKSQNADLLRQIKALGSNLSIDLLNQLNSLEKQRGEIELLFRKVETPIAKLKEGFSIPKSTSCECGHSMTPTVLFDGDCAHACMYCDQCSYSIENDMEWPFDQEFVWVEDVEALGFHAESV